MSTTMLNLKVATQVTLKETTSRRRVATNRDVVSVNEYLLANFNSKSSKCFHTKKRGGNWCSLPLGNETSRDFSVDTARPLSLYRDSVTRTLVCSYSPLRYVLKHVQYIRCVTLSMSSNILSIATCFIYFLSEVKIIKLVLLLFNDSLLQ